jgi:glycosyltransferase involved in cell wall biosynthesis
MTTATEASRVAGAGALEGTGWDTASYDAADACQPPMRTAARPAMGELSLLIFCPYFPPHVGGLEGYASDLDDELMRSGAVRSITVFTPRLPPEGAAEEQRGERYRVVRYPAVEVIPNFPVPQLWRLEFWRALRSTRPARHDVFVSHTRFFLTSALALACARLRSRPLLHVEHGSDHVQLSGRFPRLAARVYDHTLGRLVLRRADGVVAISHAAAEFVRRLAGREVPVVHRGVNTARLQATTPDGEVLAWAAGRPMAAFVGRLIDGKGVADLLSAFAQPHGTAAVLCVVGDGPRRAELEARAAASPVAKQIRFLGYLAEARAWAVMSAADVLVNPSYTEGLPTSVLEAAVLGKAVLATDVGGTSEIVTDGESALLVAPRDTAALRAGLDSLLADEALRERLGTAARESVSRRFDWSVSAARFAELAAQLAARD